MVTNIKTGGLQPASPPWQTHNPFGLGVAAITSALAVFKTVKTVTTMHRSYRGTYLQQALALWLVTGIIVAISIRMGRNFSYSGSRSGHVGTSTYSGKNSFLGYPPPTHGEKGENPDVRPPIPVNRRNAPPVQPIQKVDTPTTPNNQQPKQNSSGDPMNNFPIGGNPFVTPKIPNVTPPVQQTQSNWGSAPVSVAQTPAAVPRSGSIPRVSPPPGQSTNPSSGQKIPQVALPQQPAAPSSGSIPRVSPPPGQSTNPSSGQKIPQVALPQQPAASSKGKLPELAPPPSQPTPSSGQKLQQIAAPPSQPTSSSGQKIQQEPPPGTEKKWV